MTLSTTYRSCAVGAALALGLAGTVLAQTAAQAPMSDMDAHAHHHHEQTQDAPVKRSMVDVKPASIGMTRQDGSKTTLDKVLDGNVPTVLAFMYTSCTTVCPVTSMVLSGTQDLLGAKLAGVRIVSISIDPEYDTPQRLREYAQKYAAKPQWQHYGGTLANSVAIQKIFGAYRGDKMNHVPFFFVNGGGRKQWLRLEGFPSAEQLTKDIQDQIKG